MPNFITNKSTSNKIILFFILRHLFFTFLCKVYSYDPPDNFAISCGKTGTASFQNRNWVGDVDPKQFSFTHQNSVYADATHLFPSVDQFPYASARLSHSKFTYSFPLTTIGPKFLRFHFYPTSYANFEPQNSLFSVIANNFTLLHHFNASLWLLQDNIDTITKEFCINVETDKWLNVTFIPNINYSVNAYAFINGIEVVSMPTFLYYTDPTYKASSPFKFNKLVGFGDQDIIQYQIHNDKAMETLYRVNVGEKQVPPSEDTGMFRYWDIDYPRYLVKNHPPDIQSDYTRQPNYRNDAAPNYTAPGAVYLSARSYGLGSTEDYNVTWEFDVDSDFTYMVRLHFCEFDYHIYNQGDRVFQIFVADFMAEEIADVILWSGGHLIPVYRDYTVIIQSTEEGTSKKVKLSIKLQRLPEGMFTRWRDVLLNGIEIFKISDANNNLAGPNPEPRRLSPPQQTLQNQSSKQSKRTAVIVAVAAVSCLVLASAMGVLVFWRRRRGRDRDMEEHSWKTKNEGSTLPSHRCRYFTVAEIRAATNNFDDVFIIGVGGFGNVYKGYIDGAIPIAIKRLKPGSQQGENEFLNEIKMLSELRHHNLVSLIGYCNDGAEMILVYDFMQRGTLREYLYGSDNEPLSWKQRLEILLGAARGLHYLHEGAKQNIIHRDVKSTNILLDEKWVAKVSDFGLSKVGPTGMSTTHVSTVVKGSLGYLDPEYYKRQRLTLKSDVYSFGVVLLEVLCARPPLVRALAKEKMSLVDWFRRCYDGGEIHETIDPFLKGCISGECLKCYCQLALNCLHDDGNERPKMKDVVGVLEFAMKLMVESVDDDEKVGRGKEEEKSDDGSEMRFTSTETDESGSKFSKVSTVSGSSNEQGLFPAVVFSEIGNPRAR